jgi:hypothetical protein
MGKVVAEDSREEAGDVAGCLGFGAAIEEVGCRSDG